MKKCVVCGETKELSLFYKRADSPDGYRNDCKPCRKLNTHINYFAKHEVKKEWHRQHHKQRLEVNPNWYADNYAKNKDRLSAYDAMYYRTKNKEKRIAQVKKWARENRGRANANKKAYKVAKIQACPSWVRDEADLMWMMAEAYELAALRSDMFGFSWHVDHEVPLRGKDVSGLHVPWNLQVIPGQENMSKSNKFVGV
jgi:hypothetical protein